MTDELAILREALRAEQLKFQQETRRTSELTVMLRRVSFEIVSWDGPPGDFTRRALADEIDALLAKPINAVDPFTASREEVQAELKRRGIDVTEATRRVLDAVHKNAAPPTKAQGERG